MLNMSRTYEWRLEISENTWKHGFIAEKWWTSRRRMQLAKVWNSVKKVDFFPAAGYLRRLTRCREEAIGEPVLSSYWYATECVITQLAANAWIFLLCEINTLLCMLGCARVPYVWPFCSGRIARWFVSTHWLIWSTTCVLDLRVLGRRHVDSYDRRPSYWQSARRPEHGSTGTAW